MLSLTPALRTCKGALIASLALFLSTQTAKADNQTNFPDRFYSEQVLNLPIEIKETAGVGVENYPVSAVIPLPRGRYFNLSDFRMVDVNGQTIAAQFEVVNLWWAQDQSLRHIKAYFNTSVNAFSTANSGIATYYLKDDANQAIQTSGIKVTDSDSVIEVNTGPLKFVVNKGSFNLFEQVWLDSNQDGNFSDNEQMLQQNAEKGGVFTGRLDGDIQLDSSRNDINLVIEEQGPMRVVIRAEALTHFRSTTDHEHGFAVRIYAYANQPFVKVDYQLQNSSKDSQYAWPLYFEDMRLKLPLKFDGPVQATIASEQGVFNQAIESGIELAQKSHNQFEIRTIDNAQVLQTGSTPEGFLDVRSGNKGVTSIIRNFWQTWANGLSFDQNNSLDLQLFPSWSAQWVKDSDAESGFSLSDTGLYWLQDMQHVYKETLINFHDGSQNLEEIRHLAKTFQSYPVATLPTAWYQFTQVTLDMGGTIPFDEPITDKDERNLNLSNETVSTKYYGFNWLNFGAIEPGYRVRSCTTGGWPHGRGALIATENPKDYFKAELHALSELNVRPQWIADYTHDQDYPRLKLSDNAYCGGEWRAFKNHETPTRAANYLDGTFDYYGARDEAHGWHYHVEESYYFTGNLWVKDWYQFIGQYKRAKMLMLDPYPDYSQRALGHALATALQAYRVTGDLDLLDKIGSYISYQLRRRVVPETGGIRNNNDQDAGFMAGYLMHAVISYMDEVKHADPQAWAESFQLLSGVMNWNLQYCHFCYHSSVTKEINGRSNGTSTSLMDPQAWYAWTTNKPEFMAQVLDYLNSGINGGQKPYSEPLNWTGGYLGRFMQMAYNNQKVDQVAPAKIENLTASLVANDIIVEWERIPDAERYHLVWDYKPIEISPTFDGSKTNWFAANVIAVDATDDQTPSVTIQIESGDIYIAVFSFDAAGNMSEISQPIYQKGPIDSVQPTAVTSISLKVEDANKVQLSWPAAQDNIGIASYKILRDGVEITQTTQLSYTDTQVEYGKTYNYQVIAMDTGSNEAASSSYSTTVIDGNNLPPDIRIANEVYVNINQAALLDVSDSIEPNAKDQNQPIENSVTSSGYDEIVKVLWDLDNDGVFGNEDGEPETAQINVTCSAPTGQRQIQVKMIDSFGLESIKKIDLIVLSEYANSQKFMITADTVLDGYNANAKKKNLGAATELRTWGDGIRRSLFKADIQLPSGAKIIKAKLHLFTTRIMYPKDLNMVLYKVTKDWVEGNGTVTNANDGATWYEFDYADHYYSQQNDWQTQGGDIDQVTDYGLGANGLVAMSNIKAKTWSEFDISNLVREWAATGNNYGVLLKGLTAGTDAFYASSEYSDAQYHPYIEVIYESVPVVKLNNYSITSYGKEQDKNGGIQVDSQGYHLELTGNTWKKINLASKITENTVLELDFTGDSLAEIQAIGFDNDDVIDPSSVFQLAGIQEWGYNQHQPNAKGHVKIPIGRYFTGQYEHLVFINDNDNNDQAVSATFSNIKIYEQALSEFNNQVLFYPGNLVSVETELTGEYKVSSDGSEVTVEGDTSLKMSLPYHVTADTQLEVKVSGIDNSSLVGIGLVKGDSLDQETVFQLGGNQSFGIQEYKTDNGTGLINFTIPVGEYFTGEMKYLVLLIKALDGLTTIPVVIKDVKLVEMF
ncbi:DNRLRE domain-containing protein [Catenovulum adriaticum]|uniref:DNRLRE domain-containing protein n=1 Tax=Catenovulum adriaticum TaxID=2984846 RepID=A0ABY7AQE6_9ALTE|nr:DNRLRE domain-containing protein [Catenovulum sp. TS8]WAJ70690.1 DNRLRE domain-containing protein [Catenovulum sp. TS8]